MKVLNRWSIEFELRSNCASKAEFDCNVAATTMEEALKLANLAAFEHACEHFPREHLRVEPVAVSLEGSIILEDAKGVAR